MWIGEAAADRSAMETAGCSNGRSDGVHVMQARLVGGHPSRSVRAVVSASAGRSRAAVESLRRRISLVRNRLFDLRYGVDTLEDHDGPEFPPDAAHDDARHYARVSPRVFAALVKDIDAPPGSIFIDIGCGKGAALLLALKHGFRSVIGVELNGRLVPIARANVEKYCTNRKLDCRAQVVQGDAVAFDFPDEPTVLFLFNPFGAETMRDVLDNLERSLERNPREVVVAYMNPTQAAEFAGRRFLRQEPSRAPHCTIYRSVTPAT